MEFNENISPFKTSPYLTASNNIVSHKPPKSPTSSPKETDKASPNNRSCSKALFAHSNNNDNNNSSSNLTTKCSPVRTGVMSRLVKNSYRTKQNNILLSPVLSEQSNNAMELLNLSKIKVKPRFMFKNVFSYHLF